MQKFKHRLLKLAVVLVVLYFVLLFPDAEKPSVTAPAEKPFAWKKDSVWQLLEQDFVAARANNTGATDSIISGLFVKQSSQLHNISGTSLTTVDTAFSYLLSTYFKTAALIAAQPKQRDSFINFYSAARTAVKQQSQHWNMNDKTVRNSLYELLYGMRAAAEEVLLQTTASPFSPAMLVKNESSKTPAANILGIEVHSGDLLVSRGGAEVSALISRGNNYPGNFSHVALLYVDEKTQQPFLIEAHIEKGVAIASAEQYIKDKKLRFMVLRPRADLPQLLADPMLPHKAAFIAYNAALSRHIPYDFKMNFYDSSAMFCSEVGSYAYKKMGVQLWQGISYISSPGVINWLSAFGVENFVTQMPSDLEYDPQLSVVAEWRNPETLMKDHLDNAVMDALLEQADKGKEILYNHWQLPFVRLVKGWCIIKNKFGGIGIIPEGMSATQALKNQYFVAMYAGVKNETELKVAQFIKEHQYNPPYWQLVALLKKRLQKNSQQLY